MLFLARVLGLAFVLAMIPQAPRAALDRCVVGQAPVTRVALPDGLVEVSGLAEGPGGTVLAHGDERGVITVLDAATLQPVREVHLQGTPKDDFEGIASAGDSVALMTSTGKVYLLRLGAEATAPFTTILTGLGAHCELEGLGWHRATATLFMPCKQPKAKAVVGLTVFRYRLGPTPGRLPPIVMPGAELARVTGLAQIRATSVEVDQASGHLMVLSSKPALVLEMDSTGRAAAIKRLPGRHHPQAEGLLLTADALWVSDEGARGKAAPRKGAIAKYSCR